MVKNRFVPDPNMDGRSEFPNEARRWIYDLGSEGTITVQCNPSRIALARLPAKIGNLAGGVSATKAYMPPVIIPSVRFGNPWTPKRAVGDACVFVERLFINKSEVHPVFNIKTWILCHYAHMAEHSQRFGEIVHVYGCLIDGCK